MHISKLIVENFRSVKYASIDFRPGKNIIIGKNNSGKSNIVKALDVMFGERWPTSTEFLESDFHFCQRDGRADKFSIIAKVEGNDIDEVKLRLVRGLFVYSYDIGEKPFATENGKIEINRELVFEDLDSKGKYLEYLQAGAKQYFKRGNESYNRVIKDITDAKAFYFVFASEYSSESSHAKNEMRFIFAGQDNRMHICWGFDNSFREAFINSAVMPANRDLNSQTRINNWTWYGKLLKKIWDSRKGEPEIKGRLDRALDEIRNAGGPVFSDLSDELNRKIKFGFKDTKVSLQFVGNTGPDMHKQVQIYVDDGLDDSIIRKGSGIQSAVVIGLFTYYCSYNHNTSVLVIEEPEVFLHPQARRSISRRMDEFILQKINVGKQNQVILTTHSTEMLQVGQISTITVVRKLDSGSNTKTLDVSGPTMLDSGMRTVLKGFPSEIFFADRVVLTEGSEHIMIPNIYDSLKAKDGKFDEENYSSVAVGGKGSFNNFVVALTNIGIPWVIIADFDFLDKSILTFLRPFVNSDGIMRRITEFHSLISLKHRDMNKFLANSSLSDLNLEESIVAEEIIDHMKDNYNLWILTEGCLEDYLTEKGKSELLGDRNRKVVDHRLSAVCRNDEENLDEYIKTNEFKAALTHFNF